MSTPPKRDLTGQTFGRLTVSSGKWERRANSTVYWECTCECGNTKWAQDCNLVNGQVRSCGCLQRESIGKRKKRVKSNDNVNDIKVTLSTAEPDEDEEELSWQERQRERLRHRFQLVRTVTRHGVYFGVYDSESHRQELISPDEQEARAHIERLIDDRALPPMEYHQRPSWSKAA